jgi:hypothetical protein
MSDEPNLLGSVKHQDWGYLAQFGFVVKISKALFLDLQGSYSECRVNPAGVEANLGGLQAGIGMGLEF